MAPQSPLHATHVVLSTRIRKSHSEDALPPTNLRVLYPDPHELEQIDQLDQDPEQLSVVLFGGTGIVNGEASLTAVHRDVEWTGLPTVARVSKCATVGVVRSLYLAVLASCTISFGVDAVAVEETTWIGALVA